MQKLTHLMNLLKNVWNNKKFHFGVLSISLIFNIILAVLVFKPNDAESISEKQKKYPLLAKRIFNENFNDIIINFLELRTDLKNLSKPYGDSFSFFFEYLPTGTTIGVNEKNEFYAASLFKLPVVIAYYRQKDKMKNAEDPVLTLRSEQLDDKFGNLWKKGAGYKIKASEAVRLAIEDSDNTAIKAIIPLVSQDNFDHVYEGLDIDLKADNYGAKLTTKGYASILKSLYFSSLLAIDSSQEILDLLSRTKYIDKLPAGVPKNIKVAHKIGVFTKEEDNVEAFMDCGIVYLPNRPYSLCMLSISDEQTANERMQAISKKVYEYLANK